MDGVAGWRVIGGVASRTRDHGLCAPGPWFNSVEAVLPPAGEPLRHRPPERPGPPGLRRGDPRGAGAAAELRPSRPVAFARCLGAWHGWAAGILTGIALLLAMAGTAAAQRAPRARRAGRGRPDPALRPGHRRSGRRRRVRHGRRALRPRARRGRARQSRRPARATEGQRPPPSRCSPRPRRAGTSRGSGRTSRSICRGAPSAPAAPTPAIWPRGSPRRSCAPRSTPTSPASPASPESRSSTGSTGTSTSSTTCTRATGR